MAYRSILYIHHIFIWSIYKMVSINLHDKVIL